MPYCDDIKHAALADLPWDRLSGKNILVTGATGLIGSTLIEILLSRELRDYHVYASGRNESVFATRFRRFLDAPNFHFLKYDVREPLKSDIAFHFIVSGAGVASPQLYSTDPVSVLKSNLWGCDDLLSYGTVHGLEKFLYISSGEVYGEGDGRVFTEDYSGYVDPTSLRSCYPSAKRAAESLCIAYGHQYGIDVSIARPCHVYGPNFSESDKRVYAQFIRNVLLNEDIVMKSTGSQYRSWCYSVDCASALLYILMKGQNGAAYNIADENSNVTIKELAETIAEIGGKKVVIDIPEKIEKAGYNVVKKSLFSTAKLRALGWSCSGMMKQKIESTICAVRERQ